MNFKKKLQLIPVFITIISIVLVSLSLQCGAGGEAPEVELEIYDGPDFSESEKMCYYRIEALVTGEPEPEVKFSSDDNVRNIGSDKVEVGVEVGDSYNLKVTANNSEGTATTSIVLSGECGKEVAEEEEEEEEASGEEEATPEEEEEEEETTAVAPTISLEIYEGPTPADGICFYRVKASVTGTPGPTVTWSKDDSHGAWGTKKAQVNLYSPTETYNLTATAKNSAGEDTDSISLSWGCAPLVTEHTENFHPTIYGTVGSGGGVTTDGIAFGDSAVNTDWRGLFAFDVSSLDGKELTSAKLKLTGPDYYSVCDFKGNIYIFYNDFLPTLDAADYLPSGAYGTPHVFSYNTDPLEFSTDFLKDKVIERAASGEELQFIIGYENAVTDGEGDPEGRAYYANDITLTVKYLE